MLAFLTALSILRPPGPDWSRKVDGYTVSKWVKSDERQLLQLRDRSGRLVTEISDYRVTPLESGEALDLRKIQGENVITLTGWTGGAHGSMTYYLWSLGRHPHCLLAYDKNNISDQHDFDFVDLDGDGIPEIRSWFDGFAYTVGASYWPNLPVVLRLEGGRFVDRTSRYRSLLRHAEHEEWVNLGLGDRKADPASWSGESSAAINLIALGDLLHQESAIWARLKRTVSAREFTWLKRR